MKAHKTNEQLVLGNNTERAKTFKILHLSDLDASHIYIHTYIYRNNMCMHIYFTMLQNKT